MNPKKSDLKENIITALLIFTFAIPVIPVGLYFAYDYFFVNHEAAPAKTINYDSTETQNNVDEEIDTSTQTFGGYDCTSDCSGHQAGYDWAEENDVCDESYDGGNSESFAEGVISYAEENC